MTKFHPPDVIEDAEFLNANGAGAVDAAARLGFASAHAMEKWLGRHDRYDLWLDLKRRDPAGTHLSGDDRKKQRLMSVPTQTDTIAAVLVDADKSSRARTRKRAERIRTLVDELRTIVSAEGDEDRQREQARKEIERLERQLSEAKARLKGGGGSSSIDVGTGISAAELREWAAANGVECPPMGRIPGHVRDAYEATQGEEASA